ncbi:MAG: HD-GYP domain-containing protein [Lachnospiraceae bacterium]|nr:HD-GYP domain-containing protein [Lachnospiraceae bacterium]
MEVVATIALQDGQILGEDIVVGGNVAIKKGTKIDNIIRQKLTAFRLMSVSVMEPSDFAETYYEKVRLSKDFGKFKETYHENLIAYKVAVDSFIYNKVPFRFAELKDMAWKLCPDDLLGKRLFAYINLMVPESESTMSFAHGLNVALICKVMARWFNLTPQDTEILVYSGFLYDVGKFLLPQEIIWKPEKLSKMEFDLIKTHAFHGYYLLSKSFGVNEHIKNAVLQHHERVDGTGYPQGLTAAEIDPFAKMIAIADVYEAMTSPRTYRDPMCPYKAIQIIEDESLQKYDTFYITTFLQHIVDELIGNKVRLSNGLEGEVLMNNRNDLSRPVVKCGEQIVDLSQNRSVSITAII